MSDPLRTVFRRVGLAPLRRGALPTVYWYFSGIAVGLASSLFVSLRTATTWSCEWFVLFVSSAAFFSASMGLFVIAVIVERLRADMKSKGVLESSVEVETHFLEGRGKELICVWFFLLLSLGSAIVGFGIVLARLNE